MIICRKYLFMVIIKEGVQPKLYTFLISVVCELLHNLELRSSLFTLGNESKLSLLSLTSQPSCRS